MEAKLRLPPFQAVVRLSMIRKALELVDEYSYVLIDIDSSTIMLDDATRLDLILSLTIRAVGPVGPVSEWQ